eukprot:gene3633-biopygen1880
MLLTVLPPYATEVEAERPWRLQHQLLHAVERQPVRRHAVHLRQQHPDAAAAARAPTPARRDPRGRPRHPWTHQPLDLPPVCAIGPDQLKRNPTSCSLLSVGEPSLEGRWRAVA